MILKVSIIHSTHILSHNIQINTTTYNVTIFDKVTFIHKRTLCFSRTHSGIYSMNARHALHALRFSWNFLFHTKYQMITQVWIKFLRKAYTSSLFHCSADVWHYCILGTETWTWMYLMVQGASAGNICCMHAHLNLHSVTLASTLTNVRTVAWFITVWGENSVNCHRQL
jgi:hypothetical protein